MKIYTKTGDKGLTGLLNGERVPKDSLRIEAYGTVDELNSFIGLALTEIKSEDVKKVLQRIQNLLFNVGSDLATPCSKKVSELFVKKVFYEEIEKYIDFYSAKIEEQRKFILPGGSKSASLLHVARTICRRAERRVVALNKVEKVNPNIVIFLNRISDLLFILARYKNKVAGIPDIKWVK
jgi:cob(I)alamin adenosyltransferase